MLALLWFDLIPGSLFSYAPGCGIGLLPPDTTGLRQASPVLEMGEI
jgi:hypothetical protein